jgi:hypothetical protein
LYERGTKLGKVGKHPSFPNSIWEGLKFCYAKYNSCTLRSKVGRHDRSEASVAKVWEREIPLSQSFSFGLQKVGILNIFSTYEAFA